MRKITVSEIPEEGLQFTLSEVISHQDLDFRSPVEGFLSVNRTGSEVLLEGVLKVTIGLVCSRCLKDFEYKIHSRLHSLFQPAMSLVRDENYQLQDVELDTEFYRNDTIDLFAYIIQEVMLNIPMKPLCKTDCKGLCVTCGTDLSVGSCDCHKDTSEKGLFAQCKISKRKE